MIRAKFRCNSVSQSKDSEGKVTSESISLSAVYAEDGPNKAWSLATPSGSLSMTINNPDAVGKFEQGKEYFLDFTPA